MSADTAALLAEARLEVTRHKIAAQTGVPAALIFGEDEAAMRAQAAAALAWARPSRSNHAA